MLLKINELAPLDCDDAPKLKSPDDEVEKDEDVDPAKKSLAVLNNGDTGRADELLIMLTDTDVAADVPRVAELLMLKVDDLSDSIKLAGPHFSVDKITGLEAPREPQVLNWNEEIVDNAGAACETAIEGLGIVLMLVEKPDGHKESDAMTEESGTKDVVEVKEAASSFSLEVVETPKTFMPELAKVDKPEDTALPHALNKSPPFMVLPTSPEFEPFNTSVVVALLNTNHIV